MSNTNIKWDIKALETTFTTDTIRLCFPEELSFIQKHNWRFIQNMPSILNSINENKLSVSQLIEVKRLMEQQQAADEAVRKQAEEDAAWAEKVAANKARQYDPASLTGSHRQY